VTRAQVSLLFCVERWTRILSLHGRARSILQRAHRVLEVGGGPTNSKVVHSQVLLFLLVEHGLDLHRIPLVVETQIGMRQVVTLNLIAALCPSITHVEVTRLDRMDEVFIHLGDGYVGVLVWVHPRISCSEAVLHASAQRDRASFGCDLSHVLLPRVPIASLPCYRIVVGGVLLVLWNARANSEVGC